jgi:hypothetical protein
MQCNRRTPGWPQTLLLYIAYLVGFLAFTVLIGVRISRLSSTDQASVCTLIDRSEFFFSFFWMGLRAPRYLKSFVSAIEKPVLWIPRPFHLRTLMNGDSVTRPNNYCAYTLEDKKT